MEHGGVWKEDLDAYGDEPIDEWEELESMGNIPHIKADLVPEDWDIGVIATMAWVEGGGGWF